MDTFARAASRLLIFPSLIDGGQLQEERICFNGAVVYYRKKWAWLTVKQTGSVSCKINVSFSFNFCKVILLSYDPNYHKYIASAWKHT